MKHFLLFLGLLLSSDSALAQEIELINGTPADPNDWPASVYSRQGNSRCSATVVGERALFIAAHCVGNGASAEFSVGANSYRATCTHSPHYRGNSTADWALCKVSRAVVGIEYERVNSDPELVERGDTLRLTGYGCVRPGGGGGNDGVYRVGTSTVVGTPSGSDNDIVTRGGAALCYGDSGGPAFYEFDDGSRVLVSINSRGNIRDTSYLSSVATGQARSFIADWSNSHNVKICGVHEDAAGCRGGEDPGPDPDPDPPGDCSGEFAEFDLAYLALKQCLE